MPWPARVDSVLLALVCIRGGVPAVRAGRASSWLRHGT